MNNMQVFK